MGKDTLITLIFLLLGLFYIGGRYLKSYTAGKLNDALARGDLRRFDELRNRKLTMLLLARYDLLYSDCSRAIIAGKDEDLDRIVNRSETMKLSREKRGALYSRAFYYYLSKENKEKSLFYYEKLAEYGDSDALKEMKILYDVYLEKDSSYLEDLLEIVDEVSEDRKASYAALIAKMYENRGDTRKAKEWLKRTENAIRPE